KRKAQKWHGCHFWAAQGIERKYRKPAAGGLRNCSDSPVFCGSKKCAQKQTKKSKRRSPGLFIGFPFS
ncbi:MAG: hypothetical protein LBG07_11695, partial [Treponema sp.]|nr:hypothetical protein [Treponema sp.]